MIKKICNKCGKECEVLEIEDVIVEDISSVSPEDDEQLTYEKRVEEAEDRDRAIQASNEE